MKNSFQYQVCFILFFVSALLQAQPEAPWYQGKPIAEVRFEGLVAVSENELKGVVSEAISQKFSEDLLLSLQEDLYSLEYFDLIVPEILREDEAGLSVILKFVVQERPVVTAISFEGNKDVFRTTLLDAVLLKVGDHFNRARLRIEEKNLKDLYLERGFLDTKVSGKTSLDEEQNTVSVTFDIEEGLKTVVKEILFEGNKSIPSDRLRRSLELTPGLIFGRNKSFQENTLQEDIATVKQYYGERGYVDAKVITTKKELTFDEKQGQNRLTITLVIEEGSQYVYGGTTFEGNEVLTTEELSSYIRQTPGNVVNKAEAEQNFENVRTAYLNEGYIFNQITQQEVRDELNKIVSYVIKIVEVDRAYIEKISLEGNAKTKDFVILRELVIHEGEAYSREKIEHSLRNLYATGFFTTVNVKQDIGSQEGLMVVTFVMEERLTATPILGLNFRFSEFPIALFAQFKETNFLGRGQELGIGIDLSDRHGRAETSFFEPYLFGIPLGGRLSLSYNWAKHFSVRQDLDGNGIPDPLTSSEDLDKAAIGSEDYSLKSQSHSLRISPAVNYRWSFPLGHLSVSTGISAGLERDSYDAKLYRAASADLRKNNGRWLYSDDWTVGVSWDTRDRPLLTNRGLFLKQQVTLFGLLPLSYKGYLRSETTASYHWKLYEIEFTEIWRLKTILNLRSNFSFLVGKERGTRKLDLLRDGLFIDGMFTGRGWGRVSGGKILWNSSLELRTPLIENLIAFDLFSDVVGFWTSNEHFFSMKPSDFRFSLGAGLRFDTPQFPIGIYFVKRFSVGDNGEFNWNPEPGSYGLGDALKMDLVVGFSLDLINR